MPLRMILFCSVGLATFVAVLIGAVLFQKSWYFSGKVVEDICIKQAFRTSTYRLVDCSDGKVLVNDVEGWIIESGIVFGATNKGRYFSIDFYEKATLIFESMAEINAHLDGLGLPIYDINKEENISHLRYSDGRNRKYHPNGSPKP